MTEKQAEHQAKKKALIAISKIAKEIQAMEED